MTENQLPLVSVITPSYNQARFLEYTIQSVIQQDYPNIEYLVVDGGSSDGSLEIIKKYADHIAWWVSERDSGQAEAINKGINRSTGEIVAWLNSDDIFLPGTISQAVGILQSHPEAGFVYGNAITIDAQGRPLNGLRFADWGLTDLVSFRIICQPAVVIRREPYQQAGGLDLDYHFMLDHRLWIKIARNHPLFHVDQSWAAARHHEAAKNVSQAEGFARETMRLLEWMESQPDLQHIIETNHNKVMAGAYRLNARYLLDGGLYGAALSSYWRAFRAQPGYALKHWHRMVYALMGLLGFSSASKYYYQLNTKKHAGLLDEHIPQDWPGLSLKA